MMNADARQNLILFMKNRPEFVFHFLLKRIVLLVFSLTTIPLHAAFEEKDWSAGQSAMGGATCAYPAQSAIVHLNPAAISALKEWQVTSFYTQLYRLSELGTISFSFAKPSLRNSFGFGLNSFGQDLYRETSFLISYARTFTQRLSLGSSCNLYYLSIKGYGQATAVGLNLGLFSQIKENLSCGLVLQNVNRARIGISKEELPSGLTFGLMSKPASVVALALDLHKDLPYPLEIRTGVDFQPFSIKSGQASFLILRTGLRTNPTSFSAGVGLSWHKLSFDYSVRTHSTLGLTHGISLSWQPREKGKEKVFEIAQTETLPKIVPHLSAVFVAERINPNLASAETLSLLPGIGKKTAEEIIRYRNEHGDFQSCEDFLNVPGIGEKTVNKIKDFLTLPEKKEAIRKVNINLATVKELAKLPGLGEKTAEEIVKYRTEKGSFKAIKELMNVPGVGLKKFLEIEEMITTY